MNTPATDRPATAGMDGRPLDFWLQLVDVQLNRHFSDLLAEHGLTRREWETIRLLSRGPAGYRELDDALRPFLGGADDQRPQESLDELLDSDWVERSEDGTYLLTERGRFAHAGLEEALARHGEVVGAGITQDEVATTVSVLQRMAANLAR